MLNNFWIYEWVRPLVGLSGRGISTGQHNTERREQTASRASTGIRTNNRSIQAVRTDALDRAATVIGRIEYLNIIKSRFSFERLISQSLDPGLSYW
jgi:hypothetical protein